MRHVFSMETDRERDLQTLADAMAFCEYKKDNGICKRWQCGSCPSREELESCLSQLPACDSLRVKQLGFQSYGRLVLVYGRKKGAGEIAAQAAKVAAQAVGLTAAWLLAAAALVAFMLIPILLLEGIL